MRHYCPSCGHHLSRFDYMCGCGHTWSRERFADHGFDTSLGFDLTDGDPVVNLGDGLGIDLTDGDPVVNLGDGLGIDMETGGLEVELPGGFDLPL